nr:CHASE3 domain-containing protein [Sphingomonadaceae bacterium]
MTMTRSGWRSIPPALIAGFLLLLAMVTGSLMLVRILAGNTDRTAFMLNYGRTLNAAIAAARDGEIGQRGYLLTGERRYLTPYESAMDAIGPAIDRMRALDDPRATATAAKLEPLFDLKVNELKETIRRYDAGDRAGAIALVKTDVGAAAMDRIRIIVEGERSWTRARTAEITGRARRAVAQLTFGLIAGLVAIIALSWGWLSGARRQYAEVDAARGDAESALSALKTENAAREEAEGQVRQLQKMESMGQLTGGIAHDFNNMLAVVLGNLELAKRRLHSEPHRAEACVDNATDGARRAAALTARLLAFSRRQPLAPVPIDANKLLSGMCEMLNRTLGEAIDVQCVEAAGLWRCYADPSE